MFSPNSNANPLPQLHPSFHLSPPFLGHNGHDIFPHHHQDLLVGYLQPSNADIVSSIAGSNNPTTTDQAINIGLNGDCHFDSLNVLPIKKPVKKDRHSKIYTAQGPRDRRVRLSIGIARKFFDLQDMLGFDKASKTLDWLFTKSKTAINELGKMKNSCSTGGSKSLSSASECEVVSGTNETADNGDLQGIVLKSNPSMSDKGLYRAAFHLLARESRAKARERARERTKEKMSTRKLNELKKLKSDLSPSTLNQFRSLCQIQTCEDLGSHVTISSINQAPKEDIIEESIVIRRKLKPSSIFDCQQDLSKDTTFNSNNNFPNIPQHWDTSGIVTHSSFCAVTNMNLSAEFQTYDKPWEVYSSHSKR